MTVPFGVLEFGVEETMKYVDRKIYPEDQYPYGQWSYQIFYEKEFEKATAWFEKDIAGLLKGCMVSHNPGVFGKPAMTASVVKDGGWFGAMPKPLSVEQIPDEAVFIDKETLKELTAACEKTGFWAGDAWYMNHAANKEFNSANGGYDKHLEMPVLFIEAKYDTICETATSRLPERQKELCDDLTFVSIDAGHFVALEKWKETNEAIGSWLKQKGLGNSISHL